MSRWEAPDSDSKRHRSRFDREPSPKKPKRDGKPATEGPSSNLNLDGGDHSDQDQKHRRRLQDAVPLEAPLETHQKVEPGVVRKESDKKSNGHYEGTKHSSRPDEAPRSKSYFQHNERGNAGQVSQSHSHREPTDRGSWRDSKAQQTERKTNKTATKDNNWQKDDKSSHVRRDDNRTWRHDGFHEMESQQKPPARKRPAFREQKAPAEPKTVEEKAASDGLKPSQTDHPVLGTERRGETGAHNHRHLDRPEKPSARERESNQQQRGNFMARERDGSGGGGTYRGRDDRFNGRQQQGYYRQTRARVEKWKHDLYDEADNRIPNEEEQVAKVEAFLSSL